MLKMYIRPAALLLAAVTPCHAVTDANCEAAKIDLGTRLSGEARPELSGYRNAAAVVPIAQSPDNWNGDARCGSGDPEAVGEAIFSWTAPKPGCYLFDTSCSSIGDDDLVVGFYCGACTTTTPPYCMDNDDGCGSEPDAAGLCIGTNKETWLMQFQNAGDSYTFVVDGYGEYDTGELILHIDHIGDDCSASPLHDADTDDLCSDGTKVFHDADYFDDGRQPNCNKPRPGRRFMKRSHGTHSPGHGHNSRGNMNKRRRKFGFNP